MTKTINKAKRQMFKAMQIPFYPVIWACDIAEAIIAVQRKGAANVVFGLTKRACNAENDLDRIRYKNGVAYYNNCHVAFHNMLSNIDKIND